MQKIFYVKSPCFSFAIANFNVKVLLHSDIMVGVRYGPKTNRTEISVGFAVTRGGSGPSCKTAIMIVSSLIDLVDRSKIFYIKISVVHRWELPGNYPVFTMVMVVYHYVWRIIITPDFCITYTIMKKNQVNQLIYIYNN